MNRRAFLKTTGAIAASCAVPSAGAADKTVKPARIIDTHTHFYDPSRSQGVPWPPKSDPLLYRTVLPPDYVKLAVPQPVDGTVVVEASAWVEDNDWILELARREKFIAGFVGNLPAGTDDFSSNLKRLAANPLFRGVRINAQKLKAGLEQPAFMADMKLLVEHDLSLDLLGDTAMLPDVVKLAKALPGLRIIIDHVANLKIDGNAPANAWLEGMKAAAAHAGVHCKVSGLVEGTGKREGDAPKQVGFYRPVLDAIWREYGVTRLIYGSNWPASERFGSLQTVQQLAMDYFASKGQAATDRVFWQNAKSFYKWVGR